MTFSSRKGQSKEGGYSFVALLLSCYAFLLRSGAERPRVLSAFRDLMTPANHLHPHEKKIIAALRQMKHATAAEVAQQTGLPEAAVHKAGLWAAVKGLLRHEDTTATTITRTPEGDQYLRDGLPEKRLLLLLAQGRTLGDLKGTVELTIGLGWAKKNKWVEVRGEKLTITPAGEAAFAKKTPAEQMLETLRGDPALLDELRRRNLLDTTEKTTKTFALTPAGEQTTITETDELGQLTPELIASGGWKGKVFRPYDTTTPVPVLSPAKIHPTVQFISHVRQKLMAMGFQEIRGPFTELEFWNCDALFMPHDHPARSIHDLFHLKLPAGTANPLVLERVARAHKGGVHESLGWGHWDPKQSLRIILRSHTTCLTARKLAERPQPPAMFFSIDRVFRPDVLDATHSFEFYQCEGVVMGDLHFRHLLGFLKHFATEVAGVDEVRFRPHYFPFTEPSVEMDVRINGKWLELAGAGIFRPEMTQPLGVDVPVLGWSIGFSRLAMIKLGLSDIRELMSHDVDFLRKKPLVW